jgi:UDP-N-acetylmuramate dehydrogenase
LSRISDPPDLDRSALERHLPFRWRFGEALAAHTTYEIGGPAEALLVPRSVEEVSRTLRFCKEEGLPCQIIGLGSNLLVRDEGVRGVVVALKEGLSELRFEGSELVCGAGLALGDLARAAADRDLSGLEHMSEIPGTLGGAVFMNAGANGQFLADSFVEARALEPDGRPCRLSASDLSFGYRSSALQREFRVVLEVRLRLRPGRGEELWRIMRETAARRAAKFPLELPNAGSVFKRPAEGYPGAWIEKAGLKGTRRGGAEISERHANFIVNRGGATAREVIELMELAQREVFERFGVRLEQEQRIL